MEECLFCKIVAGDVPCKRIHEDEHILAFYDISPAAPVHALVIPKQHIESLATADMTDPVLTTALLGGVQMTAEILQLAATGYRVVTNIGSHGGQAVPHLHFHILGARPLQWPPG